MVWFFCPREKEPSYNGRTLSEWLERCRTNLIRASSSGYGCWGQADADSEAVRHIGVDAVPILLQWLGAERPFWAQPLSVANRVIKSPRIDQIVARVEPDKKLELAMVGFEVLGTNAASALPIMARKWANTTDGVELGRLGWYIGRLGVDALPFFIQASLTGDIQHHDAAIVCIYNMGDLRTNATPQIPTLIDIVQTNKDLKLRDAVIVLLGKLALDADDVVPVLTEALHSTDNETLRKVIGALNAYGPSAKQAVSELARIAADKTVATNVSEDAATVLPHLGSNATPIIITYLRTRTNPNRNHLAEEAFTLRYADKGADASPLVPVLIDCIHDEDGDVAAAAARSLGWLGLRPHESVSALTNCLADTRRDVRIAGILGLVRFTNAVPDIVRYIEPMVNDSDEIVRGAATSALKRLHGEPRF